MISEFPKENTRFIHTVQQSKFKDKTLKNWSLNFEKAYTLLDQLQFIFFILFLCFFI